MLLLLSLSLSLSLLLSSLSLLLYCYYYYYYSSILRQFHNCISKMLLLWWRHQMKHFPRYWPFVRGIHRSPVHSPHKGQWRGALKFSLICAWIKDWINNGEAGNLRRHLAHYDVIIMCCFIMMFRRGYVGWWLSGWIVWICPYGAEKVPPTPEL